MHALRCPTCNPLARRRYRKFLDNVRHEAHCAWSQALLRERPDAVTDKKGRVIVNSSSTVKLTPLMGYIEVPQDDELAPRCWKNEVGNLIFETVNPAAVQLLKDDPDEYFRRTARRKRDDSTTH